MLNALSISQPWGRLVQLNIKDIENRRYPPPQEALGRPLLIHAPREPDRQAWDKETDSALPVWHSQGTVIVEQDEPATYQFGGIVGVATLVGVVRRSRSPWFVGPFGWVLRDARPLPFTSYPGQPGIFQVSHPRLEQLVRAREDYAPSCAGRAIYTVGYRTPGALSLLQHLAENRCIILDCRYWPWSKVAYFQQFDLERLQQSLGMFYCHMFELGNKNFNKPGLPFDLVDEAAGIASAGRWLCSMGKVCLLCGCPNPWECHRGLVASLLYEYAEQESPRTPIHIVHLQASQYLPELLRSRPEYVVRANGRGSPRKERDTRQKRTSTISASSSQLPLWQELP